MNLFFLEINKQVSLLMSLYKQIQPLIKPKGQVTRFHPGGCTLLTKPFTRQNPLNRCKSVKQKWVSDKIPPYGYALLTDPSILQNPLNMCRVKKKMAKQRCSSLTGECYGRTSTLSQNPQGKYTVRK